MDKEVKNIFITGATGFLGSNILNQILQQNNSNVFLLIRGNTESEAEQKYSSLLNRICRSNKPDINLLKRVKLIKGDVAQENLGIDSNVLRKLNEKIDAIYHCAALIGFRIPLEEARRVNVGGTQNILNFAKNCNKTIKFNHISTTFIIGNKEIVLTEKDLKVGQKFNNTYEQTKFEAECLAAEYKNDGIDIMIFRPSIISGEYNTGEVLNFRLLYEALHFLSLELFEDFPADLEAKHNLVPVDIAAKAIYILATNESKSQTYHIISPNNISCYNFMEKAADFFGYKNPNWIPLDKFNMDKLSITQRRLVSPFISYFNYKGKYTADITVPILKKYNFIFPKIDDDFLQKTFRYCVDVGYINLRK